LHSLALAALVVPTHEAGAQTVLPAKSWQLAAPSHLPVLPQVDAAAAGQPLLAVVPSVIGAQVPLAAPVRLLLHAWQPPAHAPLQQKPSTQLLDAHSLLPPQAAP
jgi:hypothetical protein